MENEWIGFKEREKRIVFEKGIENSEKKYKNAKDLTGKVTKEQRKSTSGWEEKLWKTMIKSVDFSLK